MPNFIDDPEGIVVLPNGNILFVDDSGPRPGILYELTSAGALVRVHDLVLLSGGGALDDPEGLGFDPATRRLFVAFEGENTIATFVPEPPTVLLLGAGLVLAGFGRRLHV